MDPLDPDEDSNDDEEEIQKILMDKTDYVGDESAKGDKKTDKL